MEATRRITGLMQVLAGVFAAEQKALAPSAARRRGVRPDEPDAAGDEAAADLFARMVALRDQVTRLYGVQVARELRFAEDTPSEPAQLLRYAAGVSAMLRGRTLAKPRGGGTPLDVKETLTRLDAARRRLRAA